MPGRDLGTLAKIASGLDYKHEWEIYSKKALNVTSRSYSYSFETHEFYFGENIEHRKKILDLYGDGSSPVYVIAIKDVYNAPLDYDDIGIEIKNIVSSGRIPFIGCWRVMGDVYSGVSTLVNHNISDDKVLKMLEDYDQQYAAKITLEKMTYFPPE